MNKIFTKVKQGNILSENVKHTFTFMEFSLFILAIDLILPIKNQYNYYFPIYFLNPVIFFELTKISNYTLTDGDEKYINATLRNVREIENIVYYTANNYLVNLPNNFKSFSFYNNYLVLVSFSLFFLLAVSFIFLIFVKENKTKSSSIKNKYTLFFNKIAINSLYFFLKPLIVTFFLISANYLIPPIFFSKGSTFTLTSLVVLLMFFGLVVMGIFFIEYFWIAFSDKIGDQFSFSKYEQIKLFSKILICILLQLEYFDTIHFVFIRILLFFVILYLCYVYYSVFSEGLKNNIIDFICINFLVSFIIVRIINLVGTAIYSKDIIQTRSYSILLILLNFTIFSILANKLNEIIAEKIAKNLFQETRKVPLHLVLIMDKYIENIFSNSNINVIMNSLDLSILVKKLRDHKTDCINRNKANCNFCSKFDFKQCNYDQKLILKIILEFIDNMDKSQLGREERDYLVLTKIILIYIIDDFKVHRLSYYLMRSLKTTTFKFTLIINYIYEKLIIRNMRDDDSNFILLNYVELNELFLKAIKISLEFNEELKEKSKSIKKIIAKNYQFGAIHKEIQTRLRLMRQNTKNLDKSNFYKYLWCYNLVYNINFEDDILLDLPENIQLIDESIFKFSFFLLNYHYDTNCWTFKKIPYIYIQNFAYTNKEMFGKNFDSIFPPLIKDFERIKLETLFKDSSVSRFTINTYLMSKKQVIKNVDLTFDILPALYENSFIISNIINYDLNKKDNVIMVSHHGFIVYTSEIPQTYLGISNRLIITHKEYVSVQNLFGVKDFRSLDEMPKKLEIELHNYYKNYTNLYIYEPTMKDNIEELDIKEFYLFYQKAKTFMHQNKIYVTLDLIDCRNDFYFYRCNLEDDKTEKEKNNMKSKNQFHILEYFNVENEMKKQENQIDDFGNSKLFYGEAATLSAKNNTSISDLSGREYFSSISKNNLLKGQADAKVVEVISKIIWFYNCLIALLGLIFLIYIKLISQNVLNIYEVVKDIRIINSNYIDCMTHLVQLIVLDNSQDYDSLERKAKLIDANINMNFSDFLQDEFKKLSNRIFLSRAKAYTDMLTYIDIDFLKSKLDTNTENISLDGNINSMPFLDLYQQFSNLAYQLSTDQNYYTDIPIIDISSQTKVFDAFKASNNKEKIVLSMMFNYKYFNEKFLTLDRIMDDYFNTIYKDFENQVYILFIIIIIVHLISIVLSFIELYIFQKKLLIVLRALLMIRKKELNYIHFKLKSSENLVELEDKPSLIIENLKIEKHKIKLMLRNEIRIRNGQGTGSDNIFNTGSQKQTNIKVYKDMSNTNSSNNPSNTKSNSKGSGYNRDEHHTGLLNSPDRAHEREEENEKSAGVSKSKSNADKNHNIIGNNSSVMPIESSMLKNESLLKITNTSSSKQKRELYNMEVEKRKNAGLAAIKSDTKRQAKSEIYLKKNKRFFYEHLYSIVKLLIFIILSYLIYSVVIFLIIENGFGNIYISSEYIKEIVTLERLSINYLVSLKLAIAFNDTETPIKSNEFIDDPKNLYISFNKIDNLITNYKNMKTIKDYMDQLKDKNLCAVVLKNDVSITNTTVIENICAFCNTNMIFSSNDKIIISFFIQNMRNLYVSYITSNKSGISIGKIYNSEISQLVNYVFLFFIRPFIRTTKDDLGFSIYLYDLSQMVNNSFILFGVISLMDFVNFLLMKRNIANRISDMFENLKKVTISMSMN